MQYTVKVARSVASISRRNGELERRLQGMGRLQCGNNRKAAEAIAEAINNSKTPFDMEARAEISFALDRRGYAHIPVDHFEGIVKEYEEFKAMDGAGKEYDPKPFAPKLKR